MEKIKPKAWLRFARKKPQLIEVSFHKTLPPALKNNGWVQKPLYTREDLDAVAEAAVLATFEAVRDSGNYPASADMPDIDTAAIINQLTGE